MFAKNAKSLHMLGVEKKSKTIIIFMGENDHDPRRTEKNQKGNEVEPVQIRHRVGSVTADHRELGVRPCADIGGDGAAHPAEIRYKRKEVTGEGKEWKGTPENVCNAMRNHVI